MSRAETSDFFYYVGWEFILFETRTGLVNQKSDIIII